MSKKHKKSEDAALSAEDMRLLKEQIEQECQRLARAGHDFKPETVAVLPVAHDPDIPMGRRGKS